VLVGVIEARGVKENQAAAFKIRTIRNGVDDYRQRVFGTRGRGVRRVRLVDHIIFTQSCVNEIGTAQRFERTDDCVAL